MEKFDELLDKLQSRKILQTKGDWDENIPEDIWNKYLDNNHKEVAYNLDVATHRWYEIATIVIKVYDRFLGIRYITHLFSESSDYEDCYHTIKFNEMEETLVITYKQKEVQKTD